ncbi:MAG: EAL domain-containing protein [Gammaproteobacteria bacterium]
MFIEDLKKMGCRCTLDHVGSGLFSIDALRSIPADFIKIDGNLVRKIHWSPVDRAMVSAIAEIARALEAEAIAETVENRETVTTLRELGVPLGQGHLFAKPAPRFHEHNRVVIGPGGG